MGKREPLYPHVPKSKLKGSTWWAGERAILLDSPDLRTDDMSNVYVVELTRDILPHEIAFPVRVVGIISNTRQTKRGHIIVTNEYALFRTFKELVSNKPPRIDWLRVQGIDVEASVYHYRPWKAGDVAFYISRLFDEVAGVEIRQVNINASVEVVKAVIGRTTGDVIRVPTSTLYESFRHYVTEHPEATDWLLKQRIQERLGEIDNG